jgi:Tfp pilus assembly protein PilF
LGGEVKEHYMTTDIYADQLGQAWAALRQNKPRDAATGFEQILKADSNHIDAIYGLGLAHRESGQIETARTTFQKAAELVHTALAAQPGEDRFEMLQRMVQQRLNELRHK